MIYVVLLLAFCNKYICDVFLTKIFVEPYFIDVCSVTIPKQKNRKLFSEKN